MSQGFTEMVLIYYRGANPDEVQHEEKAGPRNGGLNHVLMWHHSLLSLLEEGW